MKWLSHLQSDFKEILVSRKVKCLKNKMDIVPTNPVNVVFHHYKALVYYKRNMEVIYMMKDLQTAEEHIASRDIISVGILVYIRKSSCLNGE